MAFALYPALVPWRSAAPTRRTTCPATITTTITVRRPRMAALEAPVKEDVRTRLNRLLTLTPSVETDPAGDKTKTASPKEFKVMLMNDSANSKEYVARVLTRVIPGLTDHAAWNIMNKAHTDGSAVVGIWVAEVAEGYADMLRNNGLRADIVPV